MNRRNFFRTMVGGVTAAAAVRTFPFRVYSFPETPVSAALPDSVFVDTPWRDFIRWGWAFKPSRPDVPFVTNLDFVEVNRLAKKTGLSPRAVSYCLRRDRPDVREGIREAIAREAEADYDSYRTLRPRGSEQTVEQIFEGQGTSGR